MKPFGPAPSAGKIDAWKSHCSYCAVSHFPKWELSDLAIKLRQYRREDRCSRKRPFLWNVGAALRRKQSLATDQALFAL
jgi:hypothetical protein